VKVTGVSLHFYDEAINSDKFYRAFFFADGNRSQWIGVCHWGRYGARGQLKVQYYRTEAQAERMVRAKGQEKVKKGYELLGDGSYDAAHAVSHEFLSSMLHNRIARPPVRTSIGVSFIIEEEPDLADLLAS
jgi:predicted DNA-binding WGR domain protein